MHRPISTLFPYTTLFRSRSLVKDDRAVLDAQTFEGAAPFTAPRGQKADRSEEHTSELQSLTNLVCRLLLEKKKAGRSKGGFLWLEAPRGPPAREPLLRGS